MFHGPEEDAGDYRGAKSSLSSAGGLMLAVLFFLILWLGIYPGAMIGIIRQIIITR